MRRAIPVVLIALSILAVTLTSTGRGDARPPTPEQRDTHVPRWERNGCPGVPVRVRSYRRQTKRVYRDVSAVTDGERWALKRMRECAVNKRQAGAMRGSTRWKDWRHSYEGVWRLEFERLASWDQAWAYSTSSCESGQDPAAHDPSGTYHGAFQFLLSTWQAAGGYGDPHVASWDHQAVVAVRWMHRAGDEQWPVCGD